MIAEIGLITYFTPFLFISMAVAMLVLRASGSRVFFDVVGTFQANKLIADAQASATVLESLYLDSLMGIQEAGAEIGAIFIDVVDEIVPVTVEIANARVEFQKFVDDAEEAKVIGKEIEEIGLAFGFTADQALIAGARMAQLSGVLGGQGSTAVGTEIGMIFGLISNMETEAAMQRLINLNQQTKFMTQNVTEGMNATEKANQIRKDSIRVLDQLNTVENRSAATMQQITFVMNQFASQAHLTNESIAAMAAMSATLIEAGEEQGKGGRALRMIYARLGADTNGARTAIENMGIAVFDANDDMRPFSDLLQELAEQYHTLDGRQQQQMAQQIAGNRHYTRLIKLLENVDRVRELELEAMLAQFPARDELQRRLDSEVFAYEQSEAAIQNYSASFGDALLPSLTAANNQQALFMRNLTALVEGPLGGFASRFVLVSRLMGNFLGPTFSAIVAVKNLQIALQTQHVVMRALNGEQIAAVGGMQASNLQRGISHQLIQKEVILMEQANTVSSEEANILRQKLQLYVAESKNMDLSARSRQTYRGHVTRTIAKLRELGIVIDVTTEKEINATAAKRISTNATLNQNLAMTKYGIQIGMLGSVLMMFGDNDKAMRAGMIATTVAMGLQMKTVLGSIKAMAAKNSATTTNTILQEYNTYTTHKAAVAQMGFAKATGAATVALTGLDKGIKLIAAKTIVLLGVFILVEKLASALGLFDTSFDAVGEGATGQIADTQIVMQNLALSTEDVSSKLDTLKGKYEAIKDETDSLSTEQKNAYSAEILALETVLSMQAIQKINIDDLNGSYEDYIKNQEIVAEIAKDDKAYGGFLPIGDIQEGFMVLGDSMKKHTGFGDGDLMNFLSGGKIHERDKATKEMEKFAKENADFMVFLGDKTFDSFDEMKSAFEDYQKTIQDFSDDDPMSGIMGSIEETTGAIFDFNNAREEMFFGFSSDKLTGDLVRQVQQQGVETLITSTEVIMHNNFNGMTVPEVADQIIEEIESRGNLRNYNMATS